MVKAAFIQGAALALVTSCSPFGGAEVFNCETSAQCAGGTCEPTHLCSFADTTCASGSRYGDHAGSLSNTCTGDSTMPDAAIDAPEMCTAGQTYCFDHAIETCNATGTGFDAAQRVPCALTCTTTGTPACLAASNILAADQAMCGGAITPLALTPTGAATVTINQNDITCSPTCGTTATIPRAGASPNSWYCLSTINLPSTVTVTVGTANAPVTLFSAGLVTIDATISFDGGDATGVLDDSAANDVAGIGGPGGFIGGAVTANGAGNAGGGTCAGGVGGSAGTAGGAAGAGGGGGGNQALGGAGGDGRSSPAPGTAAPGGSGGVTTACSNADARPLVGGSGGSGGGDGGCGAGILCGWPGGGGGGALHVASRTTITGAGTLSASGGAGFGENVEPGGGGGGGAGGMLLLEAPTLTFTGALLVNGGAGGMASSGPGGAGGAAGTATGSPGSSAGATADRGGAGGGGGGGRVRINATTGASCTNASPAASCTMGALRATP